MDLGMPRVGAARAARRFSLPMLLRACVTRGAARKGLSRQPAAVCAICLPHHFFCADAAAV